jgi:O-antigen/teichoic acid export membrane protein
MTDFFRKNVFIGSAEILCRIPLVFTAGYLARAVGPEIYGSWILVLVFQGLLTSLVGLGLSSSLSRLASVCEPEKARGYLLFAFMVSGIALLLAVPLTLLLRSWLGVILGLTSNMYWLLIPGLMLTATAAAEGLLDAYFKAREKITRQILFILMRTLIEVSVVFVVFVTRVIPLKDNLAALLAVYATMVLGLKVLIYPWLLMRDDRSLKKPDPGERQSFVRYGLPMIPTALVIWFVSQGDRLILGHIVEKQALGIYAFGATLASYLVYLGYAIYPLLLPRASRLYDSGDYAAVKKLFGDSQYVFLALCFGALFMITLFSQEIILFTAGSGFMGAANILIILSVAIGLEQLLGIYQYIFHLVKKPSFVLYFNLLYAALITLGVIIAARLGGVNLVPWALLVAVLVSNIVRYIVAQRQIVLPVQPGLLVCIAGAALLLASAAFVARDMTVLSRIGIFGSMVIGSLILLNFVLNGKLVPAFRQKARTDRPKL